MKPASPAGPVVEGSGGDEDVRLVARRVGLKRLEFGCSRCQQASKEEHAR
jgi:hypothetical protein